MGGAMSSITISGDTSGSVILQAPSVAGSTTLTLPSTSGTVVTTNTIPAGQVIQVVYASTQSRTSSSSTTYVDMTGMSASITPTKSSSKILVIAVAYGGSVPGCAMWFRVLRDSTSLATPGAVLYSSAGSGAEYSSLASNMTFFDSPATTSSVTYKVQLRSDATTTVVGGGPAANSYTSGTALCQNSIVLMEIAQ
jgi:hypothetical protein